MPECSFDLIANPGEADQSSPSSPVWPDKRTAHDRQAVACCSGSSCDGADQRYTLDFDVSSVQFNRGGSLDEPAHPQGKAIVALAKSERRCVYILTHPPTIAGGPVRLWVAR